MGRKKAGWIFASAVIFIILIIVFRSAKAENLDQPKDFAVSGSEREMAEKIEFIEAGHDVNDWDTVPVEQEMPSVSSGDDDDYEELEPTGILLIDEESFDSPVRDFDHVIMGQSFVEVSFDWKSDFPDTKGRSGLEFRDLYGRLVFAVSGGYNEEKKRYEFKYSSSGAACIASKIAAEPRWTTISYSPGEKYSIFFRADFIDGKVNAVIRDKDGSVAGAMKDVEISASSLAKMTAVSYAAGSDEEIDHFKLYGPDDAGAFPLAGKKVIAFGDSIVDGHLYKEAGFVEFLAEEEGMILEYNYANNGARIMPGGTVNAADGLGGTILDCQVNAAALENRDPDYIIFDGGANDAYSNILSILGTAGDTRASTFAGAFRNTILAMHEYWPNAKIIYVAVHKLSVRDLKIQEELRALELAICQDMGVEVADLYTRGWDTTDAAMNQKYAFDAFDAGGIPIAGDHTTGAHPNFLAIEELYVPVVSDALKRAGDVTIADDEVWDRETYEEEAAILDYPQEGESADSKTQAAAIKFSLSKYQAAAGKKIILKPKIEPSNAANQRIDFSITSNAKYASIESLEDGCEVTVKKSGAGKTVTVLAKTTDGSAIEKEVKIQIMKNAVTKVSINNDKQTLVPGKRVVLKASVKANGKNANTKLIWTSSNKKFLTIKQNKSGSQCVITAKAAGAGKTVTVTAQATDGTEKYAEAIIKIE